MIDEEYKKLYNVVQDKAFELWGHYIPFIFIPIDTAEMQRFIDGDEETIEFYDRLLHPWDCAVREATKEMLSKNPEMKADYDEIVKLLSHMQGDKSNG